MSPESPLTGTSYRAYRNARDRGRVPKATGPCCLCGRAGVLPIVVDHCHVCGIIRGELCNGCNTNMRFADEAATAFAAYTPEWLAQVNQIVSIPVTLAGEINRAIADLHYFLDRIGAAKVFAYQSQCSCEQGTR